MIEELKKRVVKGYKITRDEALALWRYVEPESESDSVKVAEERLNELCHAAGEIRNHFTGKNFDTCSIVNARSGHCPEDCKWCAQSAHYKTGAESYDLIDEESCISLARRNSEMGIDKFSFVTSGRGLPDKLLDRICGYARKIKSEVAINLCASMGLLTGAQLARLKEAGITRYHCNLESSPKHFRNLCTTHTFEDKIATIKMAKEAGLEICSGGIIGMGETMEDRVDLALALRELEVKSIPLNILNPIPGAPMEGMRPLTGEEILATIARFRFINPEAYIRFAGGRTLIKEIERRAIEAGINAAILGDMLTTPGGVIKEDIKNVTNMGYRLYKERMSREEICQRIEELKREKRAVILAHYYTRPEVQDVADYLGDSLGLSQEAAKTDADIILFCGVHFMAETAAIIAPGKRVLIPDPTAGCSLAESITGYDIKLWREAHPNGIVVSYVNTTAETKAYTDICCTSANALEVVSSLPEDREILFTPDAHLGAWISKKTGRKLTLWSGNCCVHHRIDSAMILEVAERYPDADILIHPEALCSSDERVLSHPNIYFYSTAGMVRHAKESPKRRFVIATEIDTIHKLQSDSPEKEFIPLSNRLICGQMKKVTLEGILRTLEREDNVVTVSPELRTPAASAIEAMLSIKVR